MLSLSSYDYHLPSHLIAQTPATPANSARCLYWDGKNFEDRTVADILHLLDPKTLIIFNDTKVVKARIPLINAIRKTQDAKQEHIKKGEIFFLKQMHTTQCETLINPGKKFQIGDTISQDNRNAKVIAITESGRILEFSHPINDILESYGHMPLPPYITYDEKLTDRYQSIMAKQDGSVAAPTASLHFTPESMQQLHQWGHHIETLTLHIGLGTFKTVHSEDITQHDIHDETLVIPHSLRTTIAKAKSPLILGEGSGVRGQPILAIGTTVTRTLESMPYIRTKIRNESSEIRKSFSQETIVFWDQITEQISQAETEAYISHLELQDFCISCSTKIFLYPGKEFRIIDQLLTNFHLPKSSLLMLVAAFIGYENMMAIYHHAIQENYRFFSFGDCMLLKHN